MIPIYTINFAHFGIASIELLIIGAKIFFNLDYGKDISTVEQTILI